MDLIQQKRAVRKELKERAAAFSEEYVKEAGQAVCRAVLQSREFLQASAVFGYLAFGNEISVDPVLREALRLGKTVTVPYIVSGKEMLAARLGSFHDLPLDRFGIRTVPPPVEAVDPESIDLILVPGAGFTLSGCRMGRGGGYYDRFLARAHGFRLGITCDRLLMEKIPAEESDQAVDALVTETRFIRCGRV